MSLGPILALATAGLVLGVALVFWALLQNWMADLIHRAEARLGRLSHVLQDTLVTLDRIMVSGQRVVAATGRAFFKNSENEEVVAVEEVKHIDPRALPADIRERLEKGESLSYDLSTGTVKT
jgi:hypothetical protein